MIDATHWTANQVVGSAPDYRSKVSGLLLDRIDIQVEVPTLRYQELASKDAGEPSTVIRDRVNTVSASNNSMVLCFPFSQWTDAYLTGLSALRIRSFLQTSR